jgi:hypothetical protein
VSISTVTSEALQLKLRELLPSQQGFSTDISASDTIIPVIDLTAAAEGSTVGTDLQNALAFGSQIAFDVTNSNADQANSPGFYRFVGTTTVFSASTLEFARINLIDATPTTKIVYQSQFPSGLASHGFAIPFDLIIFLSTGEKVNLSGSTRGNISGSYRAIADSNGVLINPSGFTPQ